MDRDATERAGPLRFRAVLTGRGQPGPIEERVGRRLVRLVDPSSPEGRLLLDDRKVELIGPEGVPWGMLSLDEAQERLRRRLEAALEAEAREPATPSRS